MKAIILAMVVILGLSASANATNYDKVCGSDDVVEVIAFPPPDAGFIFLCGKKDSPITGYVGTLVNKTGENIPFGHLEKLVSTLNRIAGAKKDIVFKAVAVK